MSKVSTDYSSKFTEKSFWTKVKKYAIKAGKDVIQKALTLYYCFLDGDTPTWAKGVILGALGYFISPIDVIPDVTPIFGYADDLGVLVAAFGSIIAHIKKEHINNAKGKLKEWFN